MSPPFSPSSTPRTGWQLCSGFRTIPGCWGSDLFRADGRGGDPGKTGLGPLDENRYGGGIGGHDRGMVEPVKLLIVHRLSGRAPVPGIACLHPGAGNIIPPPLKDQHRRADAAGRDVLGKALAEAGAGVAAPEDRAFDEPVCQDRMISVLSTVTIK